MKRIVAKTCFGFFGIVVLISLISMALVIVFIYPWFIPVVTFVIGVWGMFLVDEYEKLHGGRG